MSDASTRNLIEDLRRVVEEAEALLGAQAAEAGGRAGELRAKAGETVEKARARLEELEADLTARAKHAAEDATRFVRENPWPAVGIAAAAGLLVGVLLARR